MRQKEADLSKLVWEARRYYQSIKNLRSQERRFFTW